MWPQQYGDIIVRKTKQMDKVTVALDGCDMIFKKWDSKDCQRITDWLSGTARRPNEGGVFPPWILKELEGLTDSWGDIKLWLFDAIKEMDES